MTLKVIHGYRTYHNNFHIEENQIQNVNCETSLRLLFVLATEHTLLRMFLNIWRQILLSGDLHDDVL